jgi:polysaccharide pyruvyl transferase WcaK-like protein
MAFVVGMRLHFLIFAAIHHIPFIPLPYAPKVSGFLADLEMPMPPVQEINAGKMCAFLDRSWDSRERIKEQLRRTVPPLRERARQTNVILCEILNSLKVHH